MKWPRKKTPCPDPAVAARSRELEAKTRAAERNAQAAITQARASRERAHRHIRENHLAPLIANALREDR